MDLSLDRILNDDDNDIYIYIFNAWNFVYLFGNDTRLKKLKLLLMELNELIILFIQVSSSSINKTYSFKNLKGAIEGWIKHMLRSFARVKVFQDSATFILDNPQLFRFRTPQGSVKGHDCLLRWNGIG